MNGDGRTVLNGFLSYLQPEPYDPERESVIDWEPIEVDEHAAHMDPSVAAPPFPFPGFNTTDPGVLLPPFFRQFTSPMICASFR